MKKIYPYALSVISVLYSIGVFGQGSISGPTEPCVNSSGQYTVSGSASSVGYSWIVPTGASITAGAGTKTITVLFTTGTMGAPITVTGNGLNPPPLFVNVYLPAAAGTIGGPSTVCAGQPGVTYTVAIPYTTAYSWVPPSGATITAGGNSNTVTLSFSSSFTSGNLGVMGIAGGCGPGPVTWRTITSGGGVPTPPGAITGTSLITPGQSGISYTVPAISNATSYQWTLPFGASIASEGNTRSISVNYAASFAGGSISVKGVNSGCSGSSSSFPLTLSTLPGAAGPISGMSPCINGEDVNVTFSVPAIANATSYSWLYSTGVIPLGNPAQGGNPFSNIMVFKFPANLVQNTIAISVRGKNNLGQEGTASSITVTVYRPIGAADDVVGPSTVCLGQNNVAYSIPPIANANSYIWSLPSGVTFISESNTNGIIVNYSSTFAGGSIRVYGINGVCSAGAASILPISIPAIIQQPSSASVLIGADFAFNVVATGNEISYQWRKNGVNIEGAKSSAYSISNINNTHAGNYDVKLTMSGGCTIQSSSASLMVNSPGIQPDKNFIVTRTVQRDDVYAESVVMGLTVEDLQKSITYFDGLSRPLQNVSWQGSPLKNDIVQPFVYDKYGRQKIKYLPYVASEKTGAYKNIGFTPDNDYINDFYDNTDKIEHDDRPFTEIIYESSPLNRVLKEYGPGENWSVDNFNKFRSSDYLINIDGTEKIICWRVDVAGFPVRNTNTVATLSGPGYYSTGALGISSSKDEHGNEVREYTDKFGKVILKKVYLTGVKTDFNTSGNWAETYYIYDDFGQLRYVFQPELVKTVASSSTSNPTPEDLDNFAFQYKYEDDRHRMTEKKVPGAFSVSMVYDKRDRLVLTQDGNQRALSNKEWTFIKYDVLNRPVMTGKYVNNSIRSVVQDLVNTHYNSRALFETYVNNAPGNILGYNNNAFPLTTNTADYLTVTYYDKYDATVVPTTPTSYSYRVEVPALIGQPTVNHPSVTGLVTGSLTKNLSTGTWLRSVNYYDNKYRLIQTISEHPKGLTTLTNVLDFTGKPKSSKRTYLVGTVSTTVLETYNYDHMGRLNWVKHAINGGTDIVLTKNEYNELGQLADKKLHSTNTSGTDAKQSVDYRYNIRGWLTRINDSNLTGEASDPTDYFGMNLAYDADFETGNFAIGQKNYNGNISAIKWNVGLGQGAIKEMAYDFSYDAMNRLSSATHKQSSALNTWNTGQYDENGLQYDLNGNILGLKRKGEGGKTIDSLVYNYGSGSTRSNKLLYVKDNTLNVKGFRDANSGDAQDYRYDDNGNLTHDLNKGIGTSISDAVNKITYNYLNLPATVTKGENTIRYVYDATGRKLAQTTTFGAITKEVDYIGELQLENNELQFINHAEGRIVMAETKLIYFHNGETLAGITPSGTADTTLVTQNGTEKYVQVTSNGSASRTGMFPIGGTFVVGEGDRYKIRAKGYRTGSSFAYLLVKGNGTDIFWPGAKLPLGVASESWIEQIVTIPAAITTLEVGLVWDAVTSGQTMFLNEFEITKLTDALTPEYQYHLKDHLGNVRVTFTTKSESDQSLATLETLSKSQEQSQFIYYDEAIKVNAKVFDHSDQNNTTTETPPAGSINIHVEAESFAAQSGTYSADGMVGGCDNADWLQYNGVNMTGITALKIQCAAPQSLGRVEVRLGTTTGQLLGYLQGPNTGSWDNYSGYVIPLAAATGVQNIVLLFKDASGIMNLDWIEFTGPGPNGLPVRGISLQNTSLTLSIGQTGLLIKTITPAEATNQNVIWVSSHPAIATVNNSGIVTAVAHGTAMITVTTTSGNHSAKAVIHVKPIDNNVVSNSEFDSGTTGWELGDWTGPGYSSGGNTFSSVTGAGLSGTKALFVDVVNNNNDSWKLQPYSVLNFKLELGKTYEVSFMAKAQSARPIGVALRGEQTNTDIWNTNENLTTTAQTFTYQVTCADNVVTANSSFTIAFFLAKGIISDVWIDKVIVNEITPGGTRATSVSVLPTTLSLSVGQHSQITQTVLPANALNQVTWTSSNPTVAVVNKDGLVSALAVGTATITAKTITGNYTASTSLTVTAAATNTLLNAEFDSGTANWTLGDWTGPGYSNGGSTFTTVTGAGLSGTNALKIDVVNASNDGWTLQVFNRLNFKLEYGRTYEISFMAKGQTVRNLGAALRGEQTNTDFWNTSVSLSTSAQTFGAYQFTCYDDNVNLNTTFTMAFYLANGVISDVWIDKVIVKDVTTGSVTASSLTISPSRLSLSTGQTGQLTRTLSPATSTNPSVTWVSSDTDVATVNNNGLVTAVSPGTATITATSSDGGFTAQATVSVNPGVTSYSTRLTGVPDAKYGLAKSLSVTPGDVIELEVFAKYLDNTTTNWTQALTTLMTQIAQGTAPTGTFIDGGAAGSIGGGQLPITPIDHDNEPGTAPKAYLNYIVFDKNMSSIPLDFGSRPITTAAREFGQDGLHERLAYDGENKIVIKEAGYVYIYLSNENDTPVEVYFDDFKVNHIKGPIVSSQDYYPFGLTFNEYSRENSVDQKYLYNGKELQDELDLGWLDHGARMYMPEIGRWGVIDPLAEKFLAWAPYNFVYNNPVNFSDPTGESGEASIDEKNKTITVSSHLVFYGSKSSAEQAKKTTAEIQKMYDAAGGKVKIDGVEYSVKFNITSEVVSEDKATEMAEGNTSALNNFIRVEDSNIASRSFMELGGNGGHWLTTDKLGESTTAAHEKGHGYGLDHSEGDQRGKGQPDIMAARGTLVDPEYQYDPKAAPGAKGGTVNPAKRAVTQGNITNMFSGAKFKDGKANIGRASNTIYDKIGNPVMKKK